MPVVDMIYTLPFQFRFIEVGTKLEQVKPHFHWEQRFALPCVIISAGKEEERR